MLEIASQMILCLLLAALIGAIIGYILGKSTCSGSCEETSGSIHDDRQSTTDEHSSKDTHSIVETSAPISADTLTPTAADSEGTIDDTPMLLTAPRGGQKDNLTRIKGIGLKIEDSLNAIGIYHFDQIAGWNEENIAWADSNLGFPGRANREQWVSQAQALASGEETEFSKRVDNGEVSSSKQS